MSHYQRTHCPNCRMPYPLDGGSTCPHCGRARDARSFEEIAASGQALRQYLVYAWPLAGFLGLLYGVSILLGQWKSAPIRARSVAAASAPASYPSNGAADDARRKAADARFWAAKTRREAREVADVNAPPPLVAFGSTAPAAGTGDDSAFSESSPSVAGARVVVTSGPPAPSPPSSAPTPNAPPSGGHSGKTL